MTADERKIAAKQPIVWKDDLSDDCTAEWAGLMLRAEWMDEDYWWWSVYDMQKEEVTIEDSNCYTKRFIGGETARQNAERVAREYITAITTQQETANYLIADIFNITGRGIVLAGYITEGLISVGNTVEFIAFGYLFQRKITGVEEIRKSPPDKVNTGLLIKCNNDAEIEELRDWKPDNVAAVIYKAAMP